MEQLGEKLRRARLARGITLAELYAKTRIRPTFLEALERGDVFLIPGEVYVKGFLTTYAREVGLDPEEVLEAYRAWRAGVPDEAWNQLGWRRLGRRRNLRGLPPVRRNGQVGRHRLPLWAGLVVAILVGVVAVRWPTHDTSAPEGSAAERRLPAPVARALERSPSVQGLQDLSKALSPSSHQEVQRERRSGTEDRPSDTSTRGLGERGSERRLGAAVTESASPEGETSWGSALPPPNWDTTWQLTPLAGDEDARRRIDPSATGDEATQHAGSVGIIEPVRVRAVAIGDSWIEVTSDGRRVFRGALLPGDDRTWEGDEVVGIRLDGPAQVRLYVNGVLLEPVEGEVLEREFRAGQRPSLVEPPAVVP